MPKLPKLRIYRLKGYTSQEIRVIENGRYFMFDYRFGTIVLGEEPMVSSYEELVNLARQDSYKGKEFVDVVITHVVSAGG